MPQKEREKHKIRPGQTAKIKFWLDLWRMLRPFHKLIRSILIVIIIVEGTGLIGPYLLKLIIDNLVNFQAENIRYIMLLIFFMFIAEQGDSLLFPARPAALYPLIYRRIAFARDCPKQAGFPFAFLP